MPHGSGLRLRAREHADLRGGEFLSREIHALATTAVRNAAFAQAHNRLEARENQAPVSTASLCETPRKDWRFDGLRNLFFRKTDPTAHIPTGVEASPHGTWPEIGADRTACADAHARARETRRNNGQKIRRRAREQTNLRGGESLSRERHASATAAEDLRREFGRPPGSLHAEKATRGRPIFGRDAGLDATDSEGLISPVPEDQGIDFAQYFGTKIFRAANGRLRPVLARAAVTFRSLPIVRSGSPARIAPLALLICKSRAAAVPRLRALAEPDTAVRLARGAKPNRGSARRPLCRPEDSPFLALSLGTAIAISHSRILS